MDCLVLEDLLCSYKRYYTSAAGTGLAPRQFVSWHLTAMMDTTRTVRRDRSWHLTAMMDTTRTVKRDRSWHLTAMNSIDKMRIETLTELAPYCHELDRQDAYGNTQRSWHLTAMIDKMRTTARRKIFKADMGKAM
jgi:hypothetical protein